MPPFADPDPMAEARETDDPEEKQEIEALARELQEDIWHTVNYVHRCGPTRKSPRSGRR